MKKILLLIGCFLCVLFSATTARASHVMAGDITYKQVSGDTLLVTVKIYRDCNGIQLTNSPLAITSEKHATVLYTLPNISIRDVTGIRPECGMYSRCSGSYTYGIEEYIFQDTVVLPNDSSCSYTLSWEQCCRNGAITTGAASENFYIETTLNKCLAPTNSSPQFVRMPVILISVGQDIAINHTATDADNDFISYELVNPLGGAGSPLAYSGNWSSQKPITFLGFPYTTLSYPAGFRFDSLSGNMSFRPTKQNEVTVVTVKAKEWRKIGGVYTLIGEVIRDVQLIVINSPNNKLPKIGNPDTAFVKVCSPGNFCTEIPITDADSSDTLTVVTKHNLPNATINTTVIAQNNKRVKVCFTVDSAMMLTGGSYFFSFYVQDNTCPLPGKVEKTYFIRIGPLNVALPHLPDAYVCETDSPVVLLKSGPGVWMGPGVSSNSTSYTFSPATAAAGWHKLHYKHTDSLSGCYFNDSMRVRVLTQPKAAFTVNDSVGIAGIDTFMFTNTTTADSSFTSIWDMGDSVGMGIIQQNPKYTYNDTGLFTVTLWVDNGICPTDSVTKTSYINVLSHYLGVNQAAENGLKIYPTPTANVVYIETEADIRKIDLIDITGRINSFATPNGGNKVELNLEWLREGVYVLQVTDDAGKIYSGKVLIQR
jgi:PKD repeat protein